MAFLDAYRQQVALLIRALPFVAAEPDFALKGGTAINLFVRDMPRLSVDIDLTYLPVTDRATSLGAIDAGMTRIAERIAKGIPGAHVAPSLLRPENIVTKLVVRSENAQIKVEVTPVLRGVVFDPVLTEVAPTVEEVFGYARISVVSFADLYAGKIVAALDRQHPRDLFDVWIYSRTRASATNCAAPSLSILSATTVQWLKSLLQPAGRWRQNLRADLKG